ncbi:ERG4/ERG24 ergosterol biosynthesis protein [Saccharata proteae CBS 121410]|uniref:7-dehydrocholesterol reductase n=1 Tax=Saccharata proteae CBS 121410 TaxID=1314787 RepID=A0A9P4I1F0_9PEZI|nr:ERG4/ERG24 ergosterol biosynthesis protein [Saccharata proteae CBS 121410]
MLTVPPALTVFSWIALEYFGGSLFKTFNALESHGFSLFCERYAPRPNGRTTLFYVSWILFQAVLYTLLPGRSTGQLTHGGNLLEYRTNGFRAWQLTIATFFIATVSGVIDPAAIARHWEGLVVAFNVYGYVLSAVAYLKAHYAPSYSEDRSFSGSALYDFLMGIEFNPRFGKDWDWKLFHNGRPGIIGWTLIDLSYTAWQYQMHGYVSNSIIVVDILHALYVVDFFINESWYLRTIDICHDHFGFYLAWGSAAWLPTMYTLQVQYLARNPVNLTPLAAILALCMGVGGYTLFRSVNYQKDLVRRTKGDCAIWGKKARIMRCQFMTTDGRKHETLLLLSGWWGISRHCNYVGDLLLSYAMCSTCGLSNLLPWTYAIFMTIILVHRCFRDEQRCSAKYGDQWDQYCRLVRWRLVPGVW